MNRIGVSPAFVVSAYGPGFRARHHIEAARRAAALGFRALELEQYRRGAAGEWSAELRSELGRVLDGEGLVPSQFVAHFCLADFSSRAALEAGTCLEEFARTVEAAAAFPSCLAVTIPLPPYSIASRAELGPGAAAGARAALGALLHRYLAVAEAAGKRLALELMPHSLAGGTEGLLALRREEGLGSLACNLDTGHAWARKERLELLPSILGDALAGTHICDNSGAESLKLGPGEGTIDFAALAAGLDACGYAGSLDLEVLCGPEEVEARYARAKSALEAALAAAGEAGSRPAPARGGRE